MIVGIKTSLYIITGVYTVCLVTSSCFGVAGKFGLMYNNFNSSMY